MRRFCAAVFFIMFLYGLSYGRTITGCVTDDNTGRPVRGAKVFVNKRYYESYEETLTDAGGNYKLDVDSTSKQLHIRIKGSEQINIDIKNDTIIDVALKQEALAFEELVIEAHVIPRRYVPGGSVSRLITTYDKRTHTKTVTKQLISEVKDWVSEARLVNVYKEWPYANYFDSPAYGYFWAKAIYDSINYPDSAWKQGIEGRVSVKFKIDTHGNLADLEILDSPDDILSEEVRRVLKLAPSWSENWSEKWWDMWGGPPKIYKQIIADKGMEKYFGIFILPVVFILYPAIEQPAPADTKNGQ